MDRQGNPGQRQGDEEPTKRVEIGHQRLHRSLRLGEAVLQHFDARRADRCHAGRATAFHGPAFRQLFARGRLIGGEARRANGERFAPVAGGAGVDMDEVRARIGADAAETGLARGGDELGRSVVGHGDVEGCALQMLRPQSAADAGIVLGAAIAGIDDHRSAEGFPQRLQPVEGILIDQKPAGTAAGDLGGREVGPAPGRSRDVAPVLIEGHAGSPWKNTAASGLGAAGWSGRAGFWRLAV